MFSAWNCLWLILNWIRTYKAKNKTWFDISASFTGPSLKAGSVSPLALHRLCKPTYSVISDRQLQASCRPRKFERCSRAGNLPYRLNPRFRCGSLTETLIEFRFYFERRAAFEDANTAQHRPGKLNWWVERSRLWKTVVKLCWDNCAYTSSLWGHHAVNLRIYASSLCKITRFNVCEDHR